jgi:hypothetical protein
MPDLLRLLGLPRRKIVRIVITYRFPGAQEGERDEARTAMVRVSRWPWLRAHWEAVLDRPKWMPTADRITLTIEEVKP